MFKKLATSSVSMLSSSGVMSSGANNNSSNHSGRDRSNSSVSSSNRDQNFKTRSSSYDRDDEASDTTRRNSDASATRAHLRSGHSSQPVDQNDCEDEEVNINISICYHTTIFKFFIAILFLI